MKDFCEINDLVESVECRMQDAYEQGYETGHKDGEARGIDKMNNLSKEAYAKGLEDAWECARQINGMYYQKLNEVFTDSTHDNIFIDYSASEAMQKIKEYEQQKHDAPEINVGNIKVGDEIVDDQGRKVIVTQLSKSDGKDILKGFDGKGCPWNAIIPKLWHKTGRHFS